MLVDTNLLLYAAFAGSPEHARVKAWFEARLRSSNEGIVLCWPALYSFVRLSCDKRVYGAAALSIPDSWQAVTAYLSKANARVVDAGRAHMVTAGHLVATPGLRFIDAPDVQIAALAIEHGLVLATHDRGFRRFDGLRTFDPVEDSAYPPRR